MAERNDHRDSRLANIHADALKEFGDVQQAAREQRMQCLQARRFVFVPGAQWEGDLGEQFENKIRIEVNKVNRAVKRIINEYRNNQIGVEFTPKDGQPDEMADTCAGLYRADERDSGAHEAYDTAFDESVSGGMGAWRLRACYEDEEDDDDDRQRVRFEPIPDADTSVFFNLNAKRQDKADAKRCWVLTAMARTAYIEEWDDDPASWPQSIKQMEFDWATPDVVYVAEFYDVEEKTEVRHVYRDLAGRETVYSDDDLTDDKLAELKATGVREVRKKRVKTRKVHKYIMSGSKILEDEGIIAGRHIPIIVEYGQHAYIDNKERFMGHVTLAMDTQRLANMLRSKLAEYAAGSAISRPIFTPAEIAAHGWMWSEDAVKNWGYLLREREMDANGNPILAPLEYTKPPDIPAALAALLQIVEQDLKDILGDQDAGEQLQPNMSGKAVELVQTRMDMQAYIYLSNHGVARRRSGEVWLSMMKDICVEDKRRMKTIETDGQVGSVVMNAPGYDDETGEDAIENDITAATFDVWADVGPSSQSQRSATVRALTGIASITEDPETKQALTLATIANLEGEGLGDLRDWARARAIRMGVIKPTDEEKAQMEAEAKNAPADPQANYLQAAAEQALADASNKKAQTAKTLADAAQSQAKTAQIAVETEISKGEHAINVTKLVRGDDAPQPKEQPKTPA